MSHLNGFCPYGLLMAMDHERFFRLDDELGIIRTTLDHGADVISGMRYLDRDRHVIEALLSLGLERLVKLTFGLTLEVKTGQWPADKIKSYSHGIADMHSECRRLITGRRDLATHWVNVEHAIARLDADPVVGILLQRLESYAFGGRYYNLNYLGGNTEIQDPHVVWEAIEGLARIACPPPWDNVEVVVRSQNQILNEALAAIRSFYFQAWTQGVCGPTAKQHAFSLQGGSPLNM